MIIASLTDNPAVAAQLDAWLEQYCSLYQIDPTIMEFLTTEELLETGNSSFGRDLHLPARTGGFPARAADSGGTADEPCGFHRRYDGIRCEVYAASLYGLYGDAAGV